MQSPSEINHFRRVVIIMKSFEILILCHLLPHVQSKLDPYRFTYRSRRGTDVSNTRANLVSHGTDYENTLLFFATTNNVARLYRN